MASAVYSKSVQQRAAELVAKADKWAEGVDNRTGVRFITFTSSREPKAGEKAVYYHTRIDGRGCTCPAARKSRTGRCCHQLAAQTVAERAQEQAAVSLKDLRLTMPGCAAGCGELADSGGPFCDQHAAEAERSERLAAARRRVLLEVMA